jgi:hypothetical protein
MAQALTSTIETRINPYKSASARPASYMLFLDPSNFINYFNWSVYIFSENIPPKISKAPNMDSEVKVERAGSVSETNQKPLIRKIGCRIVPLMFLCYLMQFLDKFLINVRSSSTIFVGGWHFVQHANFIGLATDTKLKGNECSWMTTAFFLAFALAEILQGAFEFLCSRASVFCKPLMVAIFASKTPSSFFLFQFLCWIWMNWYNFNTNNSSKVSSAASSRSQCVLLGNHSCVYRTVRIIFGALEAVISSSLVLITSACYQRKETSPRYGIWYCGLGGGQILGVVLSFAFQYVKNNHFEGWRMIFFGLLAQ